MKITEALAIAFVLLVIALSITLSVKAPCSWYTWTANKDVPARCLENFKK